MRVVVNCYCHPSEKICHFSGCVNISKEYFLTKINEKDVNGGFKMSVIPYSLRGQNIEDEKVGKIVIKKEKHLNNAIAVHYYSSNKYDYPHVWNFTEKINDNTFLSFLGLGKPNEFIFNVACDDHCKGDNENNADVKFSDQYDHINHVAKIVLTILGS